MMHLIIYGHIKSFGSLKKGEKTSVWRTQEKSKLNVTFKVDLKEWWGFDT